MKHRLKILGVLIFLFGLVLAGTYTTPDCSGIACPAVIPVLTLSEHQTVDTYLSNITPPNVTYEKAGGYFIFLSDYFLPLKEFYIEVSGPIGFNVTNWLNIFPAEGFGTYEITHTNETLRAGDVLYQRQVEGIFVRNGTRIREMAVYDDPAAYKEFKYCTEHYEEIVNACRESGSPGYQLPLALGLMVLGFGLFWLGMRGGGRP